MKPKSLIAIALICLVSGMVSQSFASIPNGGFESAMTGWTAVYTDCGHNGATGNDLSVTEKYHYSGGHALWGSASLVSNYSGWGGDEDWTRTYAWSDFQNLSSVTSIQLYLTNFESSDNHYGWGWGQEVFLMLDDGTNQASVLLVDNHEHPYTTSLIEAGNYTTSKGSDGRTWYGFNVPISGFSNINLSSAKVGICWESISWCTESIQNLWANAAIDDITLVPEPAEEAIVIGGLPFIDEGNSCDYASDYAGCCGDSGSAPDVVYLYNPPADVNVNISLADSQFDTVLYVYEDDMNSPTGCIACSNDDINGNKSVLNNLRLYAGHEYFVVVDGNSAACGQYVIAVSKSRDPQNTTWYVKPNGNDLYSGQDWDNALANIGTAISMASNGHTVIVADGTYRGAKNKNLNWHGPNAHLTVKSANGPDNCIIDCNNSGVGFTFWTNFLDSSDLIEGFTVKNGSGDRGGGVCLQYNNSPIIKNCIFMNANVTYAGGGIHCFYNCSPSIINCTITGNHANLGGGIYASYYSSPLIENCTISANVAVLYGGGIYYEDPTSSVLKNCLITNNTATDQGGAIYCWWESSPSIQNCTITGNSANNGGAIYCHSYCYPTVVNSILWGNNASAGPEVYLLRFDRPSHLTISYSVLAGGPNAVYKDTDCTVNWGAGSIDQNPLFAAGPLGNYYLSRIDAGQTQDSPCVNTGSDTAYNLGICGRTTRTDQQWDTNIVDMGYHYFMPPILADLNNNCSVNFTDYAILSDQWLQKSGTLSADVAPENGDGVVDFKDLMLLAENWLEGI